MRWEDVWAVVRVILGYPRRVSKNPAAVHNDQAALNSPAAVPPPSRRRPRPGAALIVSWASCLLRVGVAASSVYPMYIVQHCLHDLALHQIASIRIVNRICDANRGQKVLGGPDSSVELRQGNLKFAVLLEEQGCERLWDDSCCCGNSPRSYISKKHSRDAGDYH